MYSILIVDDERRHLRGLENMISRLRPHYNILTAVNGEEAIDIIDVKNVDIVITDIIMPVLDGMELAKEIHKRGSNIKVVILSAHGKFEFAQRAIAYGVANYILKPVDESELIQVLNKLEYEILLEERSFLQNQSILRELQMKEEFYNELQLYKWINGNLKDIEIESLIDKNNMGYGSGRIALFEMSLSQNSNEGDFESIRNDIKVQVGQRGNAALNIIPVIINEEGLRIILIMSSKENHVEEGLYVDTVMGIKHGIENKLGGNISVSISDDIEEILKGAPRGYIMAKKAMAYNFYSYHHEVIKYDETQKYDKVKFFIDDKWIDKIFGSIIKGDIEESKVSMNLVIDSILKDGYIMPKRIKELGINILREQLRRIKNESNAEVVSILSGEIQSVINQCSSIEMMRVHINEIMESIIEIKNDERNKNNSKLFLRCMEYIEENFNQELSLEGVAEKFYYNPSYFSSQFKKYCGNTFSKYIKNLRIQKSLNLLKSTSLKVYEIAEKVGYRDSKYFNRIFKKKIGMTPEEYRRCQDD